MVERFSDFPDEGAKKTITRDQFGEGSGGEYAFNLIMSGSKCGAIDLVREKRCDNDAIQTLDFDVLGDMEVAPNCGDTHAELMRKVIEADLAKYNRVTTFSKNGWGREKA